MQIRQKEIKNMIHFKMIISPSILIIDEIGYFNMSKEDANHFFSNNICKI